MNIDPEMIGSLVLLLLGVIGIITATILVSKGYGRAFVGELSKAGRKAVGAVTKRFTRKTH